jgi:metal-dependent amidase/aminoacylase/carboxypeptidase family protein
MAVDLKKEARERFGEAQESVIEMSHRIHANPEVGWEEEKASTWL